LQYDYDPVPGNFDSTIKELLEEFTYLERLRDFLEKRPDPEFALDQSHADLPTVIKKTLFLLKKGDIEGRKIIFLGDDDFISLAVGLTKLAREITVLDIDPRVLDTLSTSAEELSFENFNIFPHDLREPFPENFINQYDVVVMDPPYTNEGLRLFLKRASQALKSNIKVEGMDYSVIGKKCLLSFGNKPPEQMQRIQFSILDHGFIINEMLPDFNHYKGASIIGKFSHLFYLQTVSNPVSTYNLSLTTGPIYTSEVKSKVKHPYIPIGYHFVGEMHFEGQEILLDNERIQKVFLDALMSAELTILDIYQHNYQPHGFSAIAILKTSHAAIHTWPEHGYISIDIFICDELSKGLEVIKFLQNQLKPVKCNYFYAERGKETTMNYEPIDIE
jgi:S-adenosylmethionine decarboxylase proenzyme